MENGTLIVTPNASEIPAAADALNAEISEIYPLVEVPDLLREVHEWTGFADQFTHGRTGDVPQNISAMLAGVLADGTTSARNAWQAHPRGSAPTRSDGCVVSTHVPKPIVPRRRA